MVDNPVGTPDQRLAEALVRLLIEIMQVADERDMDFLKLLTRAAEIREKREEM